MTTTTRLALALSLAALVAACSGHDPRSTSIGAAGGSVSTASGITLRVPAGALSQPTTLTIVETQPRDGAMARIEIQPRDVTFAVPAKVSFKVEDGNVRVSEVEHGPEGEVRHALEKRRGAGEIEVEVEHGAELEVEHGLTCETPCGDGFECDDGACKAHVEDDPATHDAGDDNGVDPAPAPGAPADDQGTDPAPAPAPTPAPIDDKGSDGPGHP